MDILLHIQFWGGFLGALTALSVAGITVAWMTVPTPPVYHRTSYFEFPLPPDWSCDTEGSETVCFPAGPPPHPASIIFTAKWRGPEDTREAYFNHLSKPRPWVSPEGETIQPEVLYVREIMLAGHGWVDSTHRNSELKNYITRYMAATTTDIGILVTYSIHQNRLDQYDPLLDQAVRGLDIYQRVAAPPN